MRIDNIISILTKDKIELNPLYQRGIVWEDERKINFIDTIMKNWASQVIIFNNDTKNNLLIVLDGKQRCTSLIEFYENKIYWRDSNNIHVYYNKIPKNKTNVRKLTNEEKSIFNRRQIQTIEYHDLTYDIQTEMFQRIQKGVTIRYADLLISYFRNENIARTFKNETINLKEKLINFNQNNLSFILDDENFNIFVLKFIHFMHNPYKFLKKNDTKIFIDNISNCDLKKIFIIMNEYVNSLKLIKEVKLPNCIYITLILVILNYKYKYCERINETNSEIIEHFKNDFENENDSLNSKFVEIKLFYEDKINCDFDIKEYLSKKKISLLRKILKNQFIKNISTINNKKQYIDNLINYYNNFGIIE